MDSEIHMLRYWVDDKGIETAFEEYYPNLAKTDPVLRDAIAHYAAWQRAIHARVRVLTEAAEEERNGPC